MKLHITNGDNTGDLLAQIYGQDDIILVWRDILHDGPVPGHLSRTERDILRIQFLTEFIEKSPLISIDDIPDPQANFQERTDIASQFSDFERITLWFEHDLYDQLQLLDIANWLDEIARSDLATLPPIELVTCNQYPGIMWFDGFGNLSPDQLASLKDSAMPYGPLAHQMAMVFWAAFSGNCPNKLGDCLNYHDHSLPYMKAAMRRWCREFPSSETGLSLTQYRILMAIAAPLTDLPRLKDQLDAVAIQRGHPLEESQKRYEKILSGPMTFGRLFVNLKHLEEAPFLGDISVMDELLTLQDLGLLTIKGQAKDPINIPDTDIQLTDTGQAICNQQAAQTRLPFKPRWRGGILVEADKGQYWDDTTLSFSDL